MTSDRERFEFHNEKCEGITGFLLFPRIFKQKDSHGNSIKITVLIWKRTMKMKARAAFLGSALKIWADHKKVGQTVSKLGSPLAQWVQAFQRP